jgi:hypothetical protein
MTAKTTPLGPQVQASPALSLLELRMWSASLLAWAAAHSGDIQAASADEVAGSVTMRWEGHLFLVRLNVTTLKEGA